MICVPLPHKGTAAGVTSKPNIAPEWLQPRTTLPNVLPPAQFWAHHPNDAEIWVPDITTYNTRAPLVDQVGGTWLDVYSGGGIYYARAGTLDILCKFQGLVSFPFDRDVRRPHA